MAIVNDVKNDPGADTLARMEARLDNALTDKQPRLIPLEEHKAAVRAAYHRGYRDGLRRASIGLRKVIAGALEQLTAAAIDNGEDPQVYSNVE